MLEVDKPTYKITFDSKCGTEVSAITVKSGEAITLPAAPTRAGFTFGGWHTDRQASNAPFSASTIVTSDITLYAKWNAVFFSLSSTSFADGGEIPPRHAYRSKQEQTEHLNISPQLSWANAPLGTTSFLVIMEDINVKSNDCLWRVFNIPADVTSLTEKCQSQQQYNNLYFGINCEERKTHTYQITIFALDLPEDYFEIDIYDRSKYPPNNEETARQKLDGHILASAFIRGTFTLK